jgi:cell wall-associated NlpC family hydrolase
MIRHAIALAWSLTLAGTALGGCASGGPAGPGSTATSAGARATAAAPAPLVGEVDRELAAMRVTRYQHSTRVDEASGTYFYDCSGLVDYALRRVLPADAAALPTSTSARPLAGDIERYLHGGLAGPIDGWQAIARVDGLRPGDVVTWLATEDSKTGDTGHVMVVLAAATPNPARPGEWLVQVADSTLNPHALDTRHTGETGLGTGTIGLVSDSGGAPTAFYWQGGVSRAAKPTEISLGRPT